MGSIMAVVAVLLIHMERTHVGNMKPISNLSSHNYVIHWYNYIDFVFITISYDSKKN